MHSAIHSSIKNWGPIALLPPPQYNETIDGSPLRIGAHLPAAQKWIKVDAGRAERNGHIGLGDCEADKAKKVRGGHRGQINIEAC